MDRRTFMAGLTASGLSGLALPGIGRAQSRVGRIIVPFAPAGATDIIAREMAEALGRALGLTFVIENRAGAGGSIGTADVARAVADGLTLGLATQSTHAVNPVVYKKLTYSPARDFSYIGEIARAPGVLVVNSRLPVSDMASFLQQVRANPGKFTYSTPGNGTIGHIWGELFKLSTNTDMMHIPYKGAAGAINDLLGGTVDSTFTSVVSALPHIKSGRLRALAVSWRERLAVLPAVQTYAEAGLPTNNDPTWYGLVGPAGIPAPMLRQLQQVLATALQNPALREKFETNGMFASAGTPEDFANTVRRDMEKVRQVSQAAKIQLD